MTAGTERSTRWATIQKDPAAFPVQPNLADYDSTYAHFDWEQARQTISGLPGGQGTNIAHEAVDRHAHGAHARLEALRFVLTDNSIQ